MSRSSITLSITAAIGIIVFALFIILSRISPSVSPVSPSATEGLNPETTITSDDQVPKSFAPIFWDRTNFIDSVSETVTHVTNLLYSQNGRIYATYHDDNKKTYVASTTNGQRWDSTALPETLTYIRDIIQLQDGTFLLSGKASGPTDPILYESRNGTTRIPVGTDVLPNRESASIWDLLELPDGRVLLATDSLANDPNAVHDSLYVLDGSTVEPLAGFPGLGILSIAIGSDNTLYVATGESDEHDDPDTAGQARVYRSEDLGETWEEVATPTGANRIYDLHVNKEGTLFAASGIRGAFLRSYDRGDTWEETTHVPSAMLPFGETGELQEKEATRVYTILELSDGRLVVGTGNQAGDVFVTSDDGDTWEKTGNTGTNVVVWGLAQDADGAIWIGTGSRSGDILKSR